jgi:hypothetical protein
MLIQEIEQVLISKRFINHYRLVLSKENWSLIWKRWSGRPKAQLQFHVKNLSFFMFLSLEMMFINNSTEHHILKWSLSHSETYDPNLISNFLYFKIEMHRRTKLRDKIRHLFWEETKERVRFIMKLQKKHSFRIPEVSQRVHKLKFNYEMDYWVREPIQKRKRKKKKRKDKSTESIKEEKLVTEEVKMESSVLKMHSFKIYDEYQVKIKRWVQIHTRDKKPKMSRTPLKKKNTSQHHIHKEIFYYTKEFDTIAGKIYTHVVYQISIKHWFMWW